MYSKIEEAEKLEAQARKLRKEEDDFWKAVKERLPEIIEKFGLNKEYEQMSFKPPVQPKSLSECLAYILTNYKAFGGKQTQDQIAENTGIPQRKISDYFQYLEEHLFNDGNIVNVKEVAEKSGLSELEVIQAASTYQKIKSKSKAGIKKGAPKNLTVPTTREGFFKIIPVNLLNHEKWTFSNQAWERDRHSRVKAMMKSHKIPITDYELLQCLMTIYRLLEEDFHISIQSMMDEYKYSQKNAFVRSHPELKVYFDAELKCMIDTKKLCPLPTERKSYIEKAKECIENQKDDPTVTKSMEYLNEWKNSHSNQNLAV